MASQSCIEEPYILCCNPESEFLHLRYLKDIVCDKHPLQVQPGHDCNGICIAACAKLACYHIDINYHHQSSSTLLLKNLCTCLPASFPIIGSSSASVRLLTSAILFTSSVMRGRFFAVIPGTALSISCGV